jgi:hypothetical protein
MVSNSTNKKDGGRLIATASVESRKAVMHSSHKNVNQKFKRTVAVATRSLFAFAALALEGEHDR